MFISYLLHYVLTHTQIQGAYVTYLGVSLACMLVFFIGLGRSRITFALLAASYCWPISLQKNENYLFFAGRIYLGMHSVVDVLAGLLIGLVVLAFWLMVDEYIDSFVISGQNGILQYINLPKIALLFIVTTAMLMLRL